MTHFHEAGVGWTMSASELWVAAQRAMPDSVRGRMNATIIMISQGAMALGGLIWGPAAAIAGASYTLLGAPVLFLTSLLLARRLSINFAGNPEERVSGVLSIRVEPKEVATIALTREVSKQPKSRVAGFICQALMLRSAPGKIRKCNLLIRSQILGMS